MKPIETLKAFSLIFRPDGKVDLLEPFRPHAVIATGITENELHIHLRPRCRGNLLIMLEHNENYLRDYAKKPPALSTTDFLTDLGL